MTVVVSDVCDYIESRGSFYRFVCTACFTPSCAGAPQGRKKRKVLVVSEHASFQFLRSSQDKYCTCYMMSRDASFGHMAI